MILAGKAWKLDDYVSTDLIAPGRYTHLRANLDEYATHVLETADPEFAPACARRDQTYIVVAGRNFGQGSSREHAARIIKLAGVPVVLAKSFARIFYRNCFNIGLPALTVDTDLIQQGDELSVDLVAGRVHDVTQGSELSFGVIPASMVSILQAGGVVQYIRQHGDLAF